MAVIITDELSLTESEQNHLETALEEHAARALSAVEEIESFWVMDEEGADEEPAFPAHHEPGHPEPPTPFPTGDVIPGPKEPPPPVIRCLRLTQEINLSPPWDTWSAWVKRKDDPLFKIPSSPYQSTGREHFSFDLKRGRLNLGVTASSRFSDRVKLGTNVGQHFSTSLASWGHTVAVKFCVSHSLKWRFDEPQGRCHAFGIVAFEVVDITRGQSVTRDVYQVADRILSAATHPLQGVEYVRPSIFIDPRTGQPPRVGFVPQAGSKYTFILSVVVSAHAKFRKCSISMEGNT